MVSYGTSIRLRYVTSSSLKSLQGKRGFKFKYQFIGRQDSSTSVLDLSYDKLGRIMNMNYPHESPIKNEIYLKAPIGYQIELQLPRLTYMKIMKGYDCEYSSDQLIFNVFDEFGDINASPPLPNVWAVCSYTNEAPKTISSLSTSSSIKIIKSKFHVLNIKLNKFNTFMLHYKVKKGIIVVLIIHHVFICVFILFASYVLQEYENPLKILLFF